MPRSTMPGFAILREEFLDGNDGGQTGPGAGQEVGQPPHLVRLGIGTAGADHVARGPAHGAGRGIEQLGAAVGVEIAALDVGGRQLDGIEYFGERRVVSERGEPAQRLGALQRGLQRLARSGAGAQDPPGLVQGARHGGALSGDEGARAGIGHAGGWRGGGRARSGAGGAFELAGQRFRRTGVGIRPAGQPSQVGAELRDRIGRGAGHDRIPGASAVAQRAGQRFQPGGGARDRRLAGHKRAAPERAGGPQQLLDGWRPVGSDQRREPVEIFTGLEDEEFVDAERSGHGSPGGGSNGNAG